MMADIFLSEDLKRLLQGKRVFFLGDSNFRCYYKDILCLYHKSTIISEKILRKKVEASCFGDKLVNASEKNNARTFSEERVFESDTHYFAFYFITRVFNRYVKQVLETIVKKKQPDVIVISSCLWDMARYGPHGVEEFKVNFVKLMKKLKQLIDIKCLVIWMTTPPLASKPYGGFLLVQLEFMKYLLRFHVMESNAFAKQVAQQYGYDVLDVHYHMKMHVHRRCDDGIHWTPYGTRYITNLLLTHIALAWGVPLPNRAQSNIIDKVLQTEVAEVTQPVIQIQQPVIQIQQPNLPQINEKKKRIKKRFKKKQKLLKQKKNASSALPRDPFIVTKFTNNQPFISAQESHQQTSFNNKFYNNQLHKEFSTNNSHNISYNSQHKEFNNLMNNQLFISAQESHQQTSFNNKFYNNQQHKEFSTNNSHNVSCNQQHKEFNNNSHNVSRNNFYNNSASEFCNNGPQYNTHGYGSHQEINGSDFQMCNRNQVAFQPSVQQFPNFSQDAGNMFCTRTFDERFSSPNMHVTNQTMMFQCQTTWVSAQTSQLMKQGPVFTPF